MFHVYSLFLKKNLEFSQVLQSIYIDWELGIFLLNCTVRGRAWNFTKLYSLYLKRGIEQRLPPTAYIWRRNIERLTCSMSLVSFQPLPQVPNFQAPTPHPIGTWKNFELSYTQTSGLKKISSFPLTYRLWVWSSPIHRLYDLKKFQVLLLCTIGFGTCKNFPGLSGKRSVSRLILCPKSYA